MFVKRKLAAGAATVALGWTAVLVPSAATAVTTPSSGDSAASTAGAASAQARPRFCDRDNFKTKVRFVQGDIEMGISRMSVRHYPVRTTISRHETVTTDHRRTFKASVSSTVGASFGASAMLKKVVGVWGEVHGDTTYQARFSTTGSESKTITTDTRMVIPAGATIVWFVGHKVVSGTFEYSSCNAADGHDPDVGIFKWRRTAWQSFGIRDDGGQRCDRAASTSVARAAKAIGCS